MAARAFLALAVAGACATVPYTGRQQLVLISPGEEMQLGLEAYRQVLHESKPSRDPRKNEWVRRVGSRIAAAADRPDFDWEFRVIQDDKTVNAFCLPGGKIAVYTGILPIAGDDEGLATVMAHEVAHAIARHGAERVSQGLLVELGAAGLDAALEKKDSAVRQGVGLAYGVGALVGFSLPYSRLQESEADKLGLIFMAKAGYDPRAAMGFWERMRDHAEKHSGGKPPEFLSTHPADETRIRQIQEELPEAMGYWQPSGRPR